MLPLLLIKTVAFDRVNISELQYLLELSTYPSLSILSGTKIVVQTGLFMLPHNELTGLEQLSLNNNKLSTLPDCKLCLPPLLVYTYLPQYLFNVVSGASALQVLFCNYNNLSSLPLLQENSKLKVFKFNLIISNAESVFCYSGEP